MTEEERLLLIETLIQLTIQYKNSYKQILQPEEKQLLQQMDWSNYDYQQEGTIKPTSVYCFLYKAYYELCLSASILTSKSPYYKPLETLTQHAISTIEQEDIKLVKLPLNSTKIGSINTQAHTNLSNFTSGNLSYILAELARTMFL